MNTLFNYLNFELRSKTNTEKSYHKMRLDYIKSRGKLINIVCKINEFINPKYKIHCSNGILGKMSFNEVFKISNEIKKNGFYIFPQRIDKQIVGKIKEFAENTDLHYLLPNKSGASYSEEAMSYKHSKGKSVRYQIRDIEKLKSSFEILQLIQDENLLAIANEYLGSKPILDLALFWWSASLDTLQMDESSKLILKDKSAQMFHFDMDRLKFLKFFIYLNDVDEHNGPHVYVRSSHKNLPKYIERDGRYDDEVIYENDSENVVEIIGRAGTLIAVDTRGLHKGKELEEKDRLIFQLEFINSLFGKPELVELKNKFEYSGNLKYFETYKSFFSI